MDKNNVYSSAKVINKQDSVQDYQLETFIQNPNAQAAPQTTPQILASPQMITDLEPVLNEIKVLGQNIQQISGRLTNIENNGMTGKEIDAQVVQAIKDLKHYANFFEQATFQMETKLLKTSISIAKKIISIEVGENSTLIAKQTITHLLDKIKSASKVKIHLNPKDYEILKNDLNLENFVELVDDPNVTAGGVVIASDLGNFDGNIEAKVSSMLESLDSVI